ncbi:UNVERIFIED_CONTAM: Signal recognition particle protein [Sesamum calycinum]|uniref:Signal recognition particle 14 kDa protein n=1 Tax=Sesamum calycinum TaxID=2727403 RepID=A0AAW2RA21_9LAMI
MLPDFLMNEHKKEDIGVGLACKAEVRLQPDPFLNELTNMFERTTEKGSVWVTLKHSSDKSKVQRNKMKTAGEKIEYRCLIRATDGKKTISTMVKCISLNDYEVLFCTYPAYDG